MLNFALSLCSSAIFFFGSDDEFSLACLASLAHVYVIYDSPSKAPKHGDDEAGKMYIIYILFF